MLLMLILTDRFTNISMETNESNSCTQAKFSSFEYSWKEFLDFVRNTRSRVIFSSEFASVKAKIDLQKDYVTKYEDSTWEANLTRVQVAKGAKIQMQQWPLLVDLGLELPFEMLSKILKFLERLHFISIASNNGEIDSDLSPVRTSDKLQGSTVHCSDLPINEMPSKSSCGHKMWRSVLRFEGVCCDLQSSH